MDIEMGEEWATHRRLKPIPVSSLRKVQEQIGFRIDARRIRTVDDWEEGTMNDQTMRSISQILHRHGPGSLIYIDECDIIAKVSNVRADPDISVNRRRLYRRFVGKMQRWKDNNGIVFGVPDIERIEEKDIAPLRPRQVEWEPYGNGMRANDHLRRDAQGNGC